MPTLASPGEHCHFFLGKIFGHDLLEQGRDALGKFGWLNHRAIACGEDARHRHHHHARQGKFHGATTPTTPLGW